MRGAILAEGRGSVMGTNGHEFAEPRTPRPVISVGIPVHNGENYLEEAIACHLGQTFDDFELLISDNGSTDLTEEICRDHASSDPRIRYDRVAQNRGAAANYNRLVHAARGPWFRWASHDDLAHPMLLERLLEHLRTAPEAVLAYGKTVLIDADGAEIRRRDDNLDLRQPTPHERLAGFARGWGMCNPVFGLIDRRVLLETSLIGPYVGSDVTLLAELALRGQFHEVPHHLFHRRIHSGSSRQGDLTLDEVAAWFDPRQTRAPRLQPRNLVMLKILHAIRASSLQPAEKLRCAVAYTGTWAVRRARVRGGAVRQRLLSPEKAQRQGQDRDGVASNDPSTGGGTSTRREAIDA